MDAQEKIKEFRGEMQKKLMEWIPDDDALVSKELGIFDRVVSRRDFLQATSVAAAYALFYQGCSDKPPSMWPEAQNDKSNKLSDAELMSVTKPSKLIIDADVLETPVEYSPLKALSSSDAEYVKLSNTLEAFNPHLMTIDSVVLSQKNNLKLADKNYAAAEVVHLSKDSSSTNYFLDIYENVVNTSQASLHKTKIELDSSADANFDKLVSSNGSYHNRVEDGIVYSQKMILVSNSNDDVNPDIRLYYQATSSNLLEPGIEMQDELVWESLELIDHFKYAEKHTFNTYSIIDVDSYGDALGNSFLYGTIQFDNLYNYGFSIAFTSISSVKPKVSFFTPKFLSIESTAVSNLNDSFNDLTIDSEAVSLKDFTLFKDQKFLPFSSITESDGSLSQDVLFSFVSFDVENAEVIRHDNRYDLKLFTQTYNSMLKRYLLSVDIGGGGVSYLLDEYDNTPSLYVKDNIFHFSFISSDIHLTDIYRDIYKADEIGFDVAQTEMKSSYVRYVKNDGDTLHILLASTYKDNYSMGIAQKSILLDSTNFELKELLKSKASLHESSYNEHTYKSLWFDDVVDKNICELLHDCANEEYKSYIVQNKQGVLNSYFIIKIEGVDFLLNFNEQGENPEQSKENPYNYQSFDNLYAEIKSKSTPFFPPIPVATEVKSLYINPTVGAQEEIVYSAIRTKKVDIASQSLVENEDKTLLSYYQSSFEALSGTWSSQELFQAVPIQSKKDYIYKEPRHIVHMYLNSVYNTPSTIEENRYIEVRFTKAITLTDLTFLETPKTYHASIGTSIFLKPDKTGKISLEIQSGVSRHDIFNGSSLLYRIVDKNDLSVEQNRPIAILSTNSTTTSSFKHFHISYKLIKRLSTEDVDNFQEGVLQSELQDPDTGYSILDTHAKDHEKKNISKVTDAYTRLAKSAVVDNEGNFVSLYAAKESSYQEVIDPLFFLYRDGMYDSISLEHSKFSKWVHHVTSSMKHSLHKAGKELSKKIKNALEKLLPEIEDLFSNFSVSMDSILSTLMSIVDKIVTFTDHLYILYVESFWEFVKGFFEFQSAFIIGEEFKKTFAQQMLSNSGTKNGYALIKEQTSLMQKEVGGVSEIIKKDIDKKIDDNFYKDAKESDKKTLEFHNRSSIQKNSVKYHHGTYTIFKLYKSIANDKDPDAPMDDSVFTCNAAFSVEKLLSCIMDKEKREIAKTLIKEYEDSNRVLHNVSSRGEVGKEKENIATLLKDSINGVIDEIDIMADGLLQIPLAFLNGSSTISLAEKALDSTMKDVFIIFGLIFFDDKDKFKSFDDVGYFISGYALFFQLSLIDPRINKSLEVQKDYLDIIKYIKDGDYRADLSKVVLDAKLTLTLSNIVAVSDILDSILVIFSTISEFFIDNLSINKFNIMQKFLTYTFFLRVVLRVPKIVKHIELKLSNPQKDSSKFLALFSDIFHITTLIIDIYMVDVFNYEDIEDGVQGGGVYSGLSVIHIFVFFYTSFFEFLSVFIYATGTEDKQTLERMKKGLELIATIPHAVLDILSGNSEEENAMSAVILLKRVSYIMLCLCYGTIGEITIGYIKGED